jgi:hypothetical protein
MGVSRISAVEPYTIEFGETTIPHGFTQSLFVQPERVFRPQHLIVDPLCAPFFTIIEIRIGKITYIKGEVSATLFPPLPLNLNKLVDEHERKMYMDFMNKYTFPTCNISEIITLVVRHRFNCPWHLDCAENLELSRSCSNVPFSAMFKGLGLT